MKIQLYGKIIERTSRLVKKADGSSYDLYSVVIEEPGQFPSYFKMSTKDVSLFGQKDGPFGVGHMVTAYGFANGRKVASYRDKVTNAEVALKVPRYDVYFNLTKLESAENPGAAASSSAPVEDMVSDDMPF